MGKIAVSIAALVFMLPLAACGNTAKKPALSIEKALLTMREENLAKRLAGRNLWAED